jgi:hypothetical protein
MSYSAASRRVSSMSGAAFGASGIPGRSAGTARARMKSSKPGGSVTSRNRAWSQLTAKVCGMSRGPYTAGGAATIG